MDKIRNRPDWMREGFGEVASKSRQRCRSDFLTTPGYCGVGGRLFGHAQVSSPDQFNIASARYNAYIVSMFRSWRFYLVDR